jgi:hypothetical protein
MAAFDTPPLRKLRAAFDMPHLRAPFGPAAREGQRVAKGRHCSGALLIQLLALLLLLHLG